MIDNNQHQRQVAAAHNDIFLRSLMKNKLSLADGLYMPGRDNKLYTDHYNLVNKALEVEGI